jgi:hypothetical protein
MESLYSNKEREFTIAPGCPWYDAQQAYRPPNVNWCEPTSCSYINEPANAWSNLGFLIVGAWVIQKLNTARERVLAHFGWAVFVMGFFSFTYHSTNNYLSQFFDFIGMYVMTSFVIAFHWMRLEGKDPRNLHSRFWFVLALNSSLFMVCDIMNIPVQNTVLLNVLPLAGLDLLAGYQEQRLREYRFHAIALVFMVVAQVFSQLDLKRIWCQPENLFLHGHAVWHVLGGFGMLFLGLHLREMLKPKS